MNVKNIIKRKVEAFVRQSAWFTEEMFPDCQKFWRHNTFNLDVVNLGSTSGVYAFNYESLPLKGANFALRRNPLFADLQILKNYESFLKPNATVILPLCPFSSLSGSYQYLEDRFYTLIYPNCIPCFSKKKQQQIIKIKNNPIHYYPLYGLEKDIIDFLKDKLGVKKQDALMTEYDMEQNAINRMNGWFKEFSLKDFSMPLSLINQDGIIDAANYLNEIIVFCKVRGFRPVMIIPPVYNTLSAHISVDARKILFDQMILKIEDKSVPFINYLDDDEFKNDKSLFKDSFLLNDKGARKFTKRVLSDLKLI